jgi:hypothetical protein
MPRAWRRGIPLGRDITMTQVQTVITDDLPVAHEIAWPVIDITADRALTLV